jgi:hypothetical protein
MTVDDAAERTRQEQALMRVGRKLQSLGQLLEQAPSHLIPKGDTPDPEVNGNRPAVVEMEELRTLFDAGAPHNVAELLREYHALMKRLRKPGS